MTAHSVRAFSGHGSINFFHHVFAKSKYKLLKSLKLRLCSYVEMTLFYAD